MKPLPIIQGADPGDECPDVPTTFVAFGPAPFYGQPPSRLDDPPPPWLFEYGVLS